MTLKFVVTKIHHYWRTFYYLHNLDSALTILIITAGLIACGPHLIMIISFQGEMITAKYGINWFLITDT